MEHDIDLMIKALRKMCFAADSPEEEDQYFLRLNLLQRERFKTKGSFLPASDGNVWSWNQEYERWFVLPA